MEKKNKMVAITLSVLSLFVLIGIVYAYFTAPVSNTNKEKYSLKTATISLEFDDGDNGISGNLNLGESVTKKFTLENTGTKDAYAKINWIDLLNTYMQGSLSYTLEQGASENGTYTSIGSGNVPVSSTKTTKTLKAGILVPVNTIYYYKLTITLNNIDVNQNSDINASFYSYFNLEEGTKPGTDTIMELVAGEPTNTTDVITKTVPEGATCTNTLAYDGTVDNNLRYVGLNPCNYVTFNDEESGWRIVGVMNNVDDETGNRETRIKLVRRLSLGSYSWDTSISDINLGRGINDWTQSALMRELNEDYLDTTLTENTTWYNGQNNKKEEPFDITKRLNIKAQDLVDNVSWKLGAQNTYHAPASIFYTAERGITVYSGRPTEWIGKVALLYPSDYGYATAGGGTDRSNCLAKNLYNYYSDNCSSNNYLKSSADQWLLSPYLSDTYIAFFVKGGSNQGGVSMNNIHSNYDVLPSVYLKSDISISGGNGTEENPYTLS